MKTLAVQSELSEVEKIKKFLEETLAELNLSEQAYYIIELSLLEMCINIIRYAYPQGKGEIFLRAWREGDKIFFEIRDSGIPFNPEETSMPDLEETIKNKKKGGLGIYLSRRLMDGFQYKRENNQNILLLYKKIKKSDSGTSV